MVARVLDNDWAAPPAPCLEELVDGYTYMIERNKLLIHHAREPEPSAPWAPQPTDAEALLRKRLMELYSRLEGCGRTVRRDSE